MRTLLLILFRPQQAVRLIKAAPQWLPTFLALSLVSVGIYMLTHPHLIQATLDHLPSTATEVDRSVVAETFRTQLGLRLAFLPIRLFIGWAAFALTLLYVCKAFNPMEHVRFAQALAAVPSELHRKQLV